MIIDNESNFLRVKKDFSENVVAIRTQEGWKNIEFKKRSNRNSLHQAEWISYDFESFHKTAKMAANVVLESVSVTRDVLAVKICVL